MPVCDICDGETFESRNGLYYCLTCATQSQDIREELIEDAQGDVDQRLAMKEGKTKKGGRSYERSSGKPWIMHEAFQIIIKKQLEFLIKIGVDAKIKDVVCQIWFKYLRETGVAFCGEPKEGQPSLGFLKKGNVYKHNVKMLGKDKPKRKKKRKEVEMDDEILELSSQISMEESLLDEKPTQDMGDEYESDLSSMDDERQSDEEVEEGSGGEAFGSFSIKPSNYTRRMQLRTTLAFSHLGLLHLNEPIFLSDIMRWVREGHFPYFEAATLLPDYMKFSYNDSSVLNPVALPQKEYVLQDAAFIIKLVGLKLPGQDVRKYTARYIMDLNLPAITHGFVNNLLKEYSPDSELWSFRGKRYFSANKMKNEETAMAYIMIALKMCYGLDDSQHQIETDLATNLDTTELRDSIPVWKDWISATRQCQAKSQASGVPWSQEQLRQIRDPRTYTNFCKTTIYGSWAHRDHEMITGRRSMLGVKKRGNRKEYRDSCTEIFSSLTERSNPTEQAISTPSTFPNTCRHGNASANEEQSDNCFKDCFARRLTIQAVKQLCTSTESEEPGEGGEEKECSSSRKYIKYLQQDFHGDTAHPSFKFLLGVLAKHIETKPEDLEIMIMKMEEFMIVGEFERTHAPSKGRKHWHQ